MSEQGSLNQQIATALGWTNLYDTEWIDDCLPLTTPAQERLVKALCGTTPDGRHDCVVSDYVNSLDAVWAAIADTPHASLSVDVPHKASRMRGSTFTLPTDCIAAKVKR